MRITLTSLRLGYYKIVLFLLAATPSLCQSTQFYSVHQSRYGTFHNYENGGSKLVSGIDYAAQIAAAQTEYFNKKPAKQLSREEVNKQIAQQYEQSAERARNQAKYYAEERERLRKLELQLLEQQRQKREVDYKSYKEALFKSDNLGSQLLLLEAMVEVKPNDEDLMLWFGVMIQASVPTKELRKATLKMSEAYRKSREKDIDAGMGESFVRNSEYQTSFSFLKADGVEQSVLLLYAAIQTNSYHLASSTNASLANQFPDVQELAKTLDEAILLLQHSNPSADEKQAVAADLYQYALQRRSEQKVDFLNVLLLTAAVKLQPKIEAYREERIYVNSMLNCRKAQAEDEAFFFN